MVTPMRPHSQAAPLRGNPLEVVLVTVCLEADLCSEVVDAVGRMNWLVDASHLHSYSSATRRPAFAPQMKATGRGIALIDYSSNVDQALTCTRYLVQLFGAHLAVVAVGDDQCPEIILEAMRAGCSEFLPSSGIRVHLQRTLHRYASTWAERAPGREGGGSILALLGAKGGVGTTALAVHLAVALSARHRKRVLLVDAQPELGHACIHLGLEGAQFTFAELVRNVSRLDSDLLQGFVAKHAASGLAVLSSPEKAQDQRPLKAEDVAKTLEFLRSEYDIVVVDCDRAFTGVTETILDLASRSYLITTPELCAVRDVSRHLDRLLRHEELADRLQIVLNRFASRSGLHPDQIERNLQLPVSVRIPNDYAAMVTSGNLGQPLVPQDKSEVALALLRWSDSLVQLQAQPERLPSAKAESFFSRFKGAGLVRSGVKA